MRRLTIEERGAALEQQIAELAVAMERTPGDKDWRQTVGMFSGDEVMKRIDEQGRKWRDAERRKARCKQAKSRQTKA